MYFSRMGIRDFQNLPGPEDGICCELVESADFVGGYAHPLFCKVPRDPSQCIASFHHIRDGDARGFGLDCGIGFFSKGGSWVASFDQKGA